MNNEEAIKTLEEREIIRLVEGDIDSAIALKIAIDAIKREDKYRWHDLRKNPNDLPPESATVYLTKEKSFTHPSIACGAWITNHESVIAWREIEPLEEVEK